MYTKYYFLVQQQHMRVDALIRLFASSAEGGYSATSGLLLLSEMC